MTRSVLNSFLSLKGRDVNYIDMDSQNVPDFSEWQRLSHESQRIINEINNREPQVIFPSMRHKIAK